MKKIIKCAMLMAGVALMFTGCGGNAETPDAVALEFIQKLQTGKATPEYIANNCTPRAAQFFTPFLPMMMADEDLKGATYSIVNTEIKGDKAIVNMRKKKVGKKEETEPMNLVKIDGTWRIDFNKEEMMKENPQLMQD